MAINEERDEHERLTYLANRGSTPMLFSRIDSRVVARLTGGLTRLHLESLAGECETGGVPLDAEALLREKKRLVEESSGGMLSFVMSEETLDAASGHEGAKALLWEELPGALLHGRDRRAGRGASELPLQVAGTNGGQPGADSGLLSPDPMGSRLAELRAALGR